MSGALRLFYNWGNHKINDGYNPGEEPLTYLFVLTTTTWESNCMNRSVCLRGITLLSVWIIKTGVDMLGMTIMTVQKRIGG